MASFNEAVFRKRVDQALLKVKTLLDNTRSPTYAADVPHAYDDKFSLVERVASSFVEALGSVLREMGVSAQSGAVQPPGPPSKDGSEPPPLPPSFAQLQAWSVDHTVTLRFAAQQRCKFVKQAKREVQVGTTSRVVEKKTSSWTGSRTKDTQYSEYQEITEYFWEHEHDYTLSVHEGGGGQAAGNLVLQRGEGRGELITRSSASPMASSSHVIPPFEVDITLLCSLLGPRQEAAAAAGGKGAFSIDRSAEDCHTPRRNKQVEALLTSGRALSDFAHRLSNYLDHDLFNVHAGDKAKQAPSLLAKSADRIFVPVLPLFEVATAVGDTDTAASAAASSVVLSGSDSGKLIREQQRSMVESFAGLRQALVNPPGAPSANALAAAGVVEHSAQLMTLDSCKLSVLMHHVRAVARSLEEGVDYVEHMLRQQVVAAIGKEVGPSDLSEYMKFHNRRLFAPDAAPLPFQYDVRRLQGAYSPEGALSIEVDGQPVSTIARVREGESCPSMKFALNAATTVSFRGPQVLHGYIQHSFLNGASPQHSLVARARQFSSFVLMVGRIAAADLFEPSHAIIIKDKDEVILPLLLDPLPTPKEFKDAIESLSPDQQRFAKAFRAMQLQSTLFGVCVVQIKPQMEALLCLPDGALTKEIKLTQDLMQLFIEYQVPSDLLTFDGDASLSLKDKLATVKGHVAAIQAIVEAQRQSELEERRQQAQAAVLDSVCSSEDSECCDDEELDCSPCEGYGAVASSFGGGGGMMKRKMRSRMSIGGRGGGGGGGGPPGSALRMSAAPMAMRRSSGAPPPPPCAMPPAPTGGMEAASRSEMSSTLRVVDGGGQGPMEPAQQQKAEQRRDGEGGEGAQEDGIPALPSSESAALSGPLVDYTQVPAQLDRSFELLDEDAALRPTTISLGNTWRRKRFKGLLAKAPEEVFFSQDGQGTEKNAAMDLLDALSRGGDLTLNSSTLHVIVCATHCFTDSVMDTLVQKSVNPIERIERSTLIVGCAIHERGVEQLLANAGQRQRVLQYSPGLFLPPAGDEGEGEGEEGAVV